MTLLPSSWGPGRVARIGAALLLVALAFGAASPAASHAQLVTVEPADGALLETGPHEVRVTFSEPVGLATGGLRVIDSSGEMVDAGEDVVAGASVSQALADLTDGWYVVTWGIVSEDGHVVRASSVFGVGDVEAVSRPREAMTETAAIVIGPARAVMDLALLVAAGAWVAWWLLLARTPRVRRLAVAALAVAFVASVIWSAAQWLDGGQGWLETPAAPAAAIRLAALVVGMAGARRWPMVAALATVVALLSVVGGGHTAGSILVSLLLMVHLLAASAWLGAGPAVLFVLTDGAVEDEHALTVVRRFSALAPIVLITVGVAGVLLALFVTDGFAGGLTTPYVLILAAKVALVAGAALIGLAARRRLRGAPSRGTLGRVFLVDAVLLPLIVIVSAGLTVTGAKEGAGRVADAEASGPASCAISAGPLSLSLLVSPGTAGRNEMRVDGVPPEALEVGLELTHPALPDAPIAVTAEASEDAVDDAWVAAGVLPLGGTWEATVAVRLNTFNQVRGSCAIALGGDGHGEGEAEGEGEPVPTVSAPGLVVSDAWVRETMMSGMAGAAYLVIHNDSGADEALVGASSPSAAAVELHQTTADEDGALSMGPVAEIPIPANGEVALEPGGYHLMLVGAVEPFQAGEEVELTLTFAGAPAKSVTVPVLSGDPADEPHGHE